MEQNTEWIEKWIETVQSKPALYNVAMKEHSDRNLVTKLWNEVCETVEEHWNDLTTQERIIVQNIWY
jgi:hypothetical protein